MIVLPFSKFQSDLLLRHPQKQWLAHFQTKIQFWPSLANFHKPLSIAFTQVCNDALKLCPRSRIDVKTLLDCN